MNNKKRITLIALTAINLILIFIPMFVSVKPLPPYVPTVYVYTSLFNLSFNSFFWLFNSQNFNIYYLLIVLMFLIIYISFALSLLFSVFMFKKEKLILGISITSVIEIAAWLAFTIKVSRNLLGLIPLTLTTLVFVLSIVFMNKKSKEKKAIC
ncbi:MAG TPA: hypothetical protein DCX39_00670 [Firmicutes bacterium]|nr:hypothetical protein [Bacillota bacterium]HAW99676.1 hypothetical protein [Bacillota bacterium]